LPWGVGCLVTSSRPATHCRGAHEPAEKKTEAKIRCGAKAAALCFLSYFLGVLCRWLVRVARGFKCLLLERCFFISGFRYFFLSLFPDFLITSGHFVISFFPYSLFLSFPFPYFCIMSGRFVALVRECCGARWCLPCGESPCLMARDPLLHGA
jgi:hypothetical protein